ncbi:PepSY-associated TM helix domain-containing protein [Candidatus Manganitrophus noduliformans]|uniref:PepSY domain-containing protein n=1 Tax=Candidatus Manganitrophus noduliformans TaxID=2606439 RepID=A0A7X6IBF5_9BACT|nr:PepSY-associated TM helix domain-containing protein [Candidatus Manganitrophus noduliformans]NKE71726.1 PepSY domain-containing protein [Candidatus Manganitrophus noduliformans]
MEKVSAKPAMTFRNILFWIHLAAGTVAGVVILVMSVTGALIAFEPQIVDFAERGVRNVPPPAPGAQRLNMETIVAKAREAFPEVPPSGVSMRSEPTSSAGVSFGREGTLFVNPYTGDVLGQGSKIHKLMHDIQDWHRWLGSREIGRPVTGVSNAAFLILVVTGVYLWWPRRWAGTTLKAVTRFNPRLQGKARDWNRHNVIGFWCAPLLVVITLTGLVMSYRWANDLLYRLAGNEPPPARQTVPPGPPLEFPLDRVDPLWARAEAQAPGWASIRLRFPQQAEGPATVFIQEPATWHPSPRSLLTLNPVTAEVVKWEPFSEYNLGRTLRAWVRPIHTGVAGGIPGQIIALIGAMGGIMLAWTGLAMAWRRIFQRKREAVSAPAVTPNQTAS